MFFWRASNASVPKIGNYNSKWRHSRTVKHELQTPTVKQTQACSITINFKALRI